MCLVSSTLSLVQVEGGGENNFRADENRGMSNREAYTLTYNYELKYADAHIIGGRRQSTRVA